MDTQPLISVVVPVYNTEKFIRTCLDSIVSQTYRNLEIIVVNDGSTEDENEIIQEYLEKDDRVRLVQHGENRGLFQARITGMEAASGDYFAFVDSDDYISVDWFRLLVRKAVATGSDIVVGEWCFEHENGRKEFLNLEHFRYMDLDLRGEAVFDEFMRQRGLDFSWHTVWNKLYNRAVWDVCADEFRGFSQARGHMVMCEDLVFSCLLWYNAKKATNVHSVNYIYRLSAAQATKISKKSGKSVLKTIDDVAAAFDFLEGLLRGKNIYDRYGGDFEYWRAVQANTLWKNLKGSSKTSKYDGYIRGKLKYGGVFDPKKLKSDLMYRVCTTVEDCYNWIESAKSLIGSEATEYVSFDVFDTLVVRPFVEPTDLFYLLNKHFNELFEPASYIDFAQMRIAAEQKCRSLLNLRHSAEDITLAEIYDQMSVDCTFDRDLLYALMQKEIELEKRFCTARGIGKELYELALDCGKKVVFCSDMYLPKEAVGEILKENGYGEYEKLYLSSDIRQTKSSGNLYRYVINDLKIEEHGSFLQIGDNWASDIVNARAHRLGAAQVSKTMDVFRNYNPGVYSGGHFKNIIESNMGGGINDLAFSFGRFHGFRNMAAVVANRIYDNPYLTYNTDTDFNANPYFIGYYPVGMYLFGILTWLIDNLSGKNIGTIHFAARDGYLLKRAYDLYRSCNANKQLPESNYLYISRKACVLLDIAGKEDFYSIINKLNVYSYSPKKLAELFRDIVDPGKYGDLPEIVKKHGLQYERNFIKQGDYERFVKLFVEDIVDFELLRGYQEKIKGYFQDIIHRGDVLFDIGYGGRAEAVLSYLLGFPIDSFYVHSNSEMLNARQSKYGFQNRCFYDYKPPITGVIREHLFMEQGPSAVGYDVAGEEVTPVFEEYEPMNYSTRLITKVVQDAALDFVADVVKTFGGYEDCMTFRKNDVAMPLEYYLHYSKPLDRMIFSDLVFEDDFGEGKKLNALEFWNGETKRLGLGAERRVSEKHMGEKAASLAAHVDYRVFLEGKPKWKKAVFMLLFDRKLFMQNVKKRLGKS